MFLLQSLPHCRPVDYERWLREFGLEPFDAQDRLVRDASPLPLTSIPGGDRELTVERVTEASAAEWVEFMERVYKLDTGPWLPRLIGRPGWHQYVVREAGEIVAARGMHIGSDGISLARDGRPRPRRHHKRLRARRGPLRIHRLRRPRPRRARVHRRHRGAVRRTGHARLSVLQPVRVHAAVRTHPLDTPLMHTSIWKFTGDPDGLLQRYDAMLEDAVRDR